MSHIVNIKEFKINLFPETMVEEVLQNVAVILSTPKYSVPLNRNLGLEQRFVDKPLSVAKTIITTEVLEAVEKYEPRAEILSVKFDPHEESAVLNPIVEVNIKNE